jgi:hypothetical protein
LILKILRGQGKSIGSACKLPLNTEAHGKGASQHWALIIATLTGNSVNVFSVLNAYCGIVCHPWNEILLNPVNFNEIKQIPSPAEETKPKKRKLRIPANESK